jgi:hypothetical protein
MKFSKPLRMAFGIAGVLAIASTAAAAHVVTVVGVSPSTAPVGVSTVVTVGVHIDPEPSLIRSSVNLLRSDLNGQSSILCSMVDDGTHGDAVAGDNTFTCQFTLFEASALRVPVRASVAFRGELRRTVSAFVTLRVLSNSTPQDTRTALANAIVAGDLAGANGFFGNRLGNRHVLDGLTDTDRADIAAALLTCTVTETTDVYELCVSQTGEFRFLLEPDDLKVWRVIIW